MAHTISSQNTHPLTVVVGKDETVRDRVGHLVVDANTDREFRFCKFRGQQQGDRGFNVVAFRLSGNTGEDSFWNVTADAAPSVGQERDFIGVIVGQSAITSGMHCYVMTKGQLGKDGQSLYPDSVFLKTVGNATAGQPMFLGPDGSVYTFMDIETGSNASGEILFSTHVRHQCLPYSTDIGSNLTRGHVKSGLLHGPGYSFKAAPE